MESGSWFTMPARSHLVFDEDSTQLWGEVIRTFGEEYKVYAHMPLDPNLN
jgi:putative transcriptional regulator